MSPRKPPALANWLLDRSGFARHNPPLAGDLLEEFRNGRSPAWYWRQTLAVIVMGLRRNARFFRRYLVAALIGWAAETGVAFALWWFHVPRQLHGMAEAAAFLVLIFGVAFVFFTRAFLSNLPAHGRTTAEKVESWNRTGAAKHLRRVFLVMFACLYFILFLMVYCVMALFHRASPAVFVMFQAEWLLLILIKDVVLPDTDPGPAKVFTTLK